MQVRPPRGRATATQGSLGLVPGPALGRGWPRAAPADELEQPEPLVQQAGGGVDAADLEQPRADASADPARVAPAG